MKMAINRRQLMAPEDRPRLTRLPLWTSGFGMFTLGTAMSFGAFKFAAQSLLSGLASVQFLSQVVFSRFVLKEKIEKYAYVGVALIISGCVFIVIFGAHGTKNYRPEELAALYGRSEYVCYLLGAGFMACVVSLMYTSMKQRIMREKNLGRFDIAHASIRERQILAVFFSIKSALFGTQAVVLAKSLSMLLIQALHPNPAYSNPLLSYQTYFILLGFISAATYWVTRLNHGLRLFEAVYLVPMMQICWILFSTIAGGIYYEEFIEFGRKEYAAYAVGFTCVLIGVALLCPRDDAKSLNAADVIYEIVSDENPLLSSPPPPPVTSPETSYSPTMTGIPKFSPYDAEDDVENDVELGDGAKASQYEKLSPNSDQHSRRHRLSKYKAQSQPPPPQPPNHSNHPQPHDSPRAQTGPTEPRLTKMDVSSNLDESADIASRDINGDRK